MTKIYLLVAPAHNNIYIPVAAFHELDKALEFLKEEFPELEVKEYTFPWGKEWRMRWDLKNDEKFALRVFKSYYGGCGECTGLDLMEVEEGQKTFAFDLD